MGKKWLNIVYKEKNSTRLKKHYREWADGYDSDLKDWGYAYPSKVKQILEKYITVKKDSKILDAGCGTCLLYTSPSPRDLVISRMPSSA